MGLWGVNNDSGQFAASDIGRRVEGARAAVQGGRGRVSWSFRTSFISVPITIPTPLSVTRSDISFLQIQNWAGSVQELVIGLTQSLSVPPNIGNVNAIAKIGPGNIFRMFTDGDIDPLSGVPLEVFNLADLSVLAEDNGQGTSVTAYVTVGYLGGRQTL